jgi:hypothetical protein
MIAHHKRQGSLKNSFSFYTPMHPGWLRCDGSEYPDIPEFAPCQIDASNCELIFS